MLLKGLCKDKLKPIVKEPKSNDSNNKSENSDNKPEEVEELP